MLTLADSLKLPLEAVTQTFAILGKRGSGKTTTATVFTEELLKAQQQVIVIDPLDVTWGLRASRDGKSAGFPITVLGGDHADLPLEASAGTVLADFVVEHHAPVILSLRHFSMNDQRRFVTDFCERLYALKGKQTNRTALHVVIDEVDEFAHQRIPSGHERLFGAIDRLVRRGRASGIGVTMISQRPAVVHKDILSQAEVLICHQTISPQDRKALETWVEAHDAHDQRETFMSTIATLQRGEAWVWSPGWLDIFKRVTVRDRKTFDSSATPKAGERVIAPKELAKVDLDQLQTRIAATIEKAKADDPRELRKRIAELERQNREAGSRASAPVVERVEVPVLDPADLRTLESLVGRVDELLTRASHALEGVGSVRNELNEILVNVQAAVAAVAVPRPTRPVARPAVAVRRPVSSAAVATAVDLGKCERAILRVLSHFPDGCTAGKLTLLSGYRYSGGFKNSLSNLRQSGFMDGANTGVMTITEAGLSALGDVDPLPIGAELADYWLQHPSLGKCERAILQALLEHPKGLTSERLCQITDYEYSGGFKNALSNLRTAGVMVGKNTEVMRAHEDLF